MKNNTRREPLKQKAPDEDSIEVPRAWVEGLQGHIEQLKDATLTTNRALIKERLDLLFGYISSAKTLLEKGDK